MQEYSDADSRLRTYQELCADRMPIYPSPAWFNSDQSVSPTEAVQERQKREKKLGTYNQLPWLPN